MSWDFKASLIDAVDKIHCAGVQHNDLLERKIVIDDKNRPFIIDFDHAEDHDCELSMYIDFHSQEPDPGDFGCDELHAICRLAGMWTPRFIKFILCYVPVHLAEIPERLATQAPKTTSPEEALAYAHEAIYEYHEYTKRRNACDWTAYH